MRTDLGPEVLEVEVVAIVNAVVGEGRVVVVEDLLVGGGDALAVDTDLHVQSKPSPVTWRARMRTFAWAAMADLS